MILPDLMLPFRSNQTLTEYGLDTLNEALDKRHFKSYPHNIVYQYNSRGFRDAEWSADNALADAIWCVGDSFTTGMGNCYEHIWPQILQHETQYRTINVSLDGASNEWIAQQSAEIIKQVQPVNLVIMWSFFHRRQINDVMSAEKTQYWDGNTTYAEDFDNFYNLCTSLDNSKTNIIHLLIPKAFFFYDADITTEWNKIRAPSWPVQLPSNIDSLPAAIVKELKKIDSYDKLRSIQRYNTLPIKIKNYAGEVNQLDYARDGLHFGEETSRELVDLILPLLR